MYMFNVLNFIYLFCFSLGLHCCMWAFSVVALSKELLSSCSGQASYCSGFSCRTNPASRHTVSIVAACGLWTTGSVVVMHNLSCPTHTWNLSRPRIEPMSVQWQVHSYPLYHWWSSSYRIFKYSCLSLYTWSPRTGE